MRGPALAAALLGATTFALAADARPPRVEVQEVADTGIMPKGASISPDGKRFYVTNFGQENLRNITVYDAQTLRLIDTINVPGIVVESVLSPDGATIYASNFERGTVQFIDVEKKKIRGEVKTGSHPKVLALSREGDMLYAANWSGASVTQIDTRAAKVVRTLPAGLHPRGMAVTTGGTLFIANFDGASIDVYSGEGYAEHHRLPACVVPRHLALSPDETMLFISCFHDSQVEVLDVATEKIVHRVPIGSSPKSLEVSKDGRWVFSADYGRETNSVSIVDTADWTARVYTIPGMDRGSGIAVMPDGQHALVTGWYDNHVYLVGFEGSGGHPRESLQAIQRWIGRRKHDG
jgi:DNA-binding beta-propeller fold protein YncE